MTRTARSTTCILLIVAACALSWHFIEYRVQPSRGSAETPDFIFLPHDMILSLGSALLPPEPGSDVERLNGMIGAERGLFSRHSDSVEVAAIFGFLVPLLLVSISVYLSVVRLRPWVKITARILATIALLSVLLGAIGTFVSPKCTLLITTEATTPDRAYFALLERQVCDGQMLSTNLVWMGRASQTSRIVVMKIAPDTAGVRLTWINGPSLVVTVPVSAAVKKYGPYAGWPHVAVRRGD